MTSHKHFWLKQRLSMPYEPLGNSPKPVCLMCGNEFTPRDPKHFLCSAACVIEYRELRSKPRRRAA